MKPRFRFSLKAMVVVLTLGVVAFGFLTTRMRRARQQAAAIDLIMQDSQFNKCRYGFEMTDELLFDFPVTNIDAESPVPSWLRNWLGADFFHTVEYVDVLHSDPTENPIVPMLKMGNAKFVDAGFLAAKDFPSLTNCRNLEFLSVQNSSVVDLEPISTLRQLRHLDIQATSVSDLQPIENLIKMRRLHAQMTSIHDLQPLHRMKSLERLSIGQTQVSDLSPIADLTNLTQLKAANIPLASLQPLRQLKNLDTLEISINPETQAELTVLSGLTKLRELHIVGEELVINDVAFLDELTELIVLIFHGIELDIEDLSFVTRLPNLKYLHLGTTKLSEDELKFLQKSMPDCHIVYP
ncbi:hypothetical protein N9Y42_07000 [Mariniblastus sp.]|nr:hypothetical protein [Mariniblastus sp.]